MNFIVVITICGKASNVISDEIYIISNKEELLGMLTGYVYVLAK